MAGRDGDGKTRDISEHTEPTLSSSSHSSYTTSATWAGATRLNADPVSQGHLPWSRSHTHGFGVKRRLGPNSSTCPPAGDAHTGRSHASLPALQTPGPRAAELPRRASPSGSPWSAACSSRPWWRWRPRSRAAEPRWAPPGHNFRSPVPEGDS